MDLAPNRLRSSRPRVLVVDDHPLVRATIRRLLDAEFDIVGEAPDGERGLAMALALEPDVLVLDVELPKMDGFRVAARLNDLRSATRIVFVSVHPEHAFGGAGPPVGGTAYIGKTDLRTQLAPAVRVAAAGL